MFDYKLWNIEDMFSKCKLNLLHTSSVYYLLCIYNQVIFRTYFVVILKHLLQYVRYVSIVHIHDCVWNRLKFLTTYISFYPYRTKKVKAIWSEQLSIKQTWCSAMSVPYFYIINSKYLYSSFFKNNSKRCRNLQSLFIFFFICEKMELKLVLWRRVIDVTRFIEQFVTIH